MYSLMFHPVENGWFEGELRFTDPKDGHGFWFHLKLFVPLPMMEVEAQDSAAPVHNHSVHGRVPLLAQVSSPTPECVVPVHQITLKSMVCHVGTFVSQEILFINPTTARLTLSIVFIDSPNFCVVEATRPSVPVAQLTIWSFGYSEFAFAFQTYLLPPEPHAIGNFALNGRKMAICLIGHGHCPDGYRTGPCESPM